MKQWGYAGTGGEKHGLTIFYPTLAITIMLQVAGSYGFLFFFSFLWRLWEFCRNMH